MFHEDDVGIAYCFGDTHHDKRKAVVPSPRWGSAEFQSRLPSPHQRFTVGHGQSGSAGMCV